MCSIASSSESTTLTEMIGPRYSVAKSSLAWPAWPRAPASACGRRRAVSTPCSASACGDARQKRRRDVAVHHQRLGRVAHAHPLALGVDRDPLGHVQIGGAIDVHVAIAGEVLDDRHLGFGGHAANQAFAAARNRQVDVLGPAPENARRPRDRSCSTSCTAPVGQADFVGRLLQQGDDGAVGVQRLPCRRAGSRRCRS